MTQSSTAEPATASSALESSLKGSVQDTDSRISLCQAKLKQAYAEAQIYCRPFEYQRILKQAEKDLFAIASGKVTFATQSARSIAIEQAEQRKERSQAEVKENPPKYAQTLKKFCDFVSAAQELCRVEKDASRRDFIFKDTLSRLEELMAPIDNIWNGIPGRTPDLVRPGVIQCKPGERPLCADERIEQIKQHLLAKVDTVDGAQAKRLEKVAGNAVIQEMMRLHAAGELPEDGSVIFFTKEGLLLYQIELNAPKRLDRAQNEEAAQRHAENTPAFIDINRLKKGLGPDGAGIWRFIGQENRIIGAAVLRTVYKDGKPVELPGNRTGKRVEPMVKKQVEALIGEVPGEVVVEMPYGNLLNAMRSKKLSRQKAESEQSIAIGNTGEPCNSPIE